MGNKLLYYILRDDNKIWIAQHGGGYKSKVELIYNGYTINGISETFPIMPVSSYNGEERKTDKAVVDRANTLLTKLFNTDIFWERKIISLSLETNIQALLSELHNAISGIIGELSLTKKDIEIIEKWLP